MSEERLVRIEQNLEALRDEVRTDIRNELTGINARLDGHDRRFDGMDQRFDGMDRRFDGMDRRFDALEAKVDRTLVKFESLEDKVPVFSEAQASLAETVKKGFADLPRQISEAMRVTNLTVSSHSTQLMDHQSRIEKLEARRARH